MRIDAAGARMDLAGGAGDGAGRTLDLLGPIPLPITLDDRELVFDWYAAVRSAELDRVDELARTLRNEGRQRLFAALTASMAVKQCTALRRGADGGLAAGAGAFELPHRRRVRIAALRSAARNCSPRSTASTAKAT